MALIGSTALTLADWAKRYSPDGSGIAPVVEILNQQNEMLDDALFIEGNLPTGHRSVVRTGLPDVAWRKLNYGVAQSKSTTATVDDSCGMLESFAVTDKDVAELNGNTNEFRLSESLAFLESMNQGMATTLIYGDTDINPERFLGLSARYSKVSGVANSVNVIDALGASTDNTSVWLIGWGPTSASMAFPKGTKAGLIHENLGLDTVTDAVGGKYRAYVDHYQWKAGFVLRDWRYVVRICNIDVSNLVGESSAADLIKLMIKAIHRIPAMGACRPVFYVNRTVREMLDIQALSKAQYMLQTGNDAAGKPMTSMRGIPIKTMDAILNTEARVV